MQIYLVMIFLGSVFLSSDNFVDTSNAIKFYFTVIAILFGIIILCLKNKDTKTVIQKLTSLSTLKGLFIVGLLQAVYGILQHIGICNNYNDSSMTGSFDNPAGFSALLSLLLPIGVYWCLTSKNNIERSFTFISVGVIILAVILSGSRTGILAICISIIFIVIKYKFLPKIRALRHCKLLVLSTIVIGIASVFFLYKCREESANGRLLVWRISTKMLKDSQLVGYGYDGFKSAYMDYQALYFKTNPNSTYSQLADNITHPFNEFIKITVNYGIIGLLLSISLLYIIYGRVQKNKSSEKMILETAYITLIIFFCFSYPLRYTPIWFLLGYYTLILFSEFIFSRQPSIIEKLSIICICIICIICVFIKLSNEIEWKNIAVKSLQGQTNQMLPRYNKLYPHLRYNAAFLYNYGAELNIAKQYQKSITILNECQKQWADYYLQMLLADNYYQIGDMINALQYYQRAASMIPCRFLPLFKQFEILKLTGRISEAIEIAKKIVLKPIKVQSGTISVIIRKANNYLIANDIYITQSTSINDDF